MPGFWPGQDLSEPDYNQPPAPDLSPYGPFAPLPQPTPNEPIPGGPYVPTGPITLPVPVYQPSQPPPPGTLNEPPPGFAGPIALPPGGFSGLFASSLFQVSRRVRRLTPFGRSLQASSRLMVRVGLDALTRGFGYFTPEPPVISGSRALVPYVARAPLFNPYYLLALVALPTAVADATLHGGERGMPYGPYHPRPLPGGRGAARLPGSLEEQAFEQSGALETILRNAPNVPAPPKPVDTGFRGFLKRELAGETPNFGSDWLRQQLGLPKAATPNAPVTPQPRAPGESLHGPGAPVEEQPTQRYQQTTIPKPPPAAPKTRRGVQLGMGFGSILLGNVVQSALSGRSGRAPSFPAPTIAPAPTSPTTPNPAMPSTGLLTMLNVGALGSASTSTSSCSCGPRGPRRKCLERAPVAWRGGRNKGKSAGSKCVRYAQRRT